MNWIFLAPAAYEVDGELSSPVALRAPSIRINNNDITTIFAPRASPTFTGLTTVATLTTSGEVTANGRVISRADGSFGTTRCYPIATSGESRLGLYRNTTGSGTVAGDFWAVGQGIYTAGDRNFGIGCSPGPGLCLGITSSGTVSIPGALQIGGTSTDTLYQQRSWVQAVLPVATVNGPVTITSQSGVATLTSGTRTGTGTYAIAWSPNINNFNYIVQGNVRNAAGYVSFNGTTVSGCNILTYNAAGVLADLACHFMIFRMP